MRLKAFKKKRVSKLGKLSLGVNFIYIFTLSFYAKAPQSVITQSSPQYHFTLLGSMSIKAVHITLMKLSPDHQSYNFTWLYNRMIGFTDNIESESTKWVDFNCRIAPKNGYILQIVLLENFSHKMLYPKKHFACKV